MLLAPRLGLTGEILPASYFQSWEALGFVLPAVRYFMARRMIAKR